MDISLPRAVGADVSAGRGRAVYCPAFRSLPFMLRPYPRVLAVLATLSAGFLLAPRPAAAQTRPATETVTDDDAPPADSWALLFGIGSSFTLTPFSGATISAKYQTTARRAWRVGLTLDASETDREGSGSTRFATTGSTDTTRTEDRLEGTSSGGIGTLSIERVAYLRRRDAFHLFAGVGPFARYGRQRFSNEIFRAAPTLPPARNETRDEQARTDIEWAAGAAGSLGAEWFVRGGLSLTAEYGANVGYTRGITRFTSRSTSVFTNGGPISIQERVSRERQVFGGWSLDAPNVRLGLAVYF